MLMSDFELVLLSFLIPIIYVIIYISGKYDILNLIIHMLEERCDEITKRRDRDNPKIMYEKYKSHWCWVRGISLKDVDEEVGINGGECYVSYDEFLDNEFRNESYMKYLTNFKGENNV